MPIHGTWKWGALLAFFGVLNSWAYCADIEAASLSLCTAYRLASTPCALTEPRNILRLVLIACVILPSPSALDNHTYRQQAVVAVSYLFCFEKYKKQSAIKKMHGGWHHNGQTDVRLCLLFHSVYKIPKIPLHVLKNQHTFLFCFSFFAQWRTASWPTNMELSQGGLFETNTGRSIIMI